MKKEKILLVLSLFLGCALTGCVGITDQPESRKTEKPAIIIDTDPGTDDSTALMLAQANLGDRVKLVVSTYGNSPLVSTTSNALKLTDLYDMDTKVLEGAAGPVEGAREPSLTEGEDGISAAGLPESSREIIKEDPSDYLYEFLKNNPGADYVVLGPMTNLANLLEKHPESEKLIGRVVTMAGGLEVFNMEEWAEFNIYCDPIGAEKVFASSLPICLVPLDTTNQIALTHEEVLGIPDGKTEGSDYLTKILLENEKSSLNFGLPGVIIYDAAALAYLIEPELFTTRTIGIKVSAEENYGQTLETDERKNVTLVENPNRDGVYDLLVRSGHCVFSTKETTL